MEELSSEDDGSDSKLFDSRFLMVLNDDVEGETAMWKKIKEGGWVAKCA